MVGHRRTVALLLGALALVAVSGGKSAQLKLAMEDRADLNPRQVSLGAELAGLGLGIVVSWSERLHDSAE